MSSHVPPLEATGVVAGYPGHEPALSDINLRFDRGAFTAILGPNGAGKSTLVKVLTGLMNPLKGTVSLFGQDIGKSSRRQIARRIAVVPQSIQVAFDFRVREVVMMGRAPRQGAMLVSSEQDRALVGEILERTELGMLADRHVRELSGGEQMRVAIARALAQQPDILVLDESTAHLDLRHTVALHALVRREVRERGLVCISVLHDLNEAAQNADQVVLVQNGRILSTGDVATVMTYRTLREAFGVELYVGVNELDSTRYFVPMRESAKP